MTSDDWEIIDCGLCGTSFLCRIFRFPAAAWRVPLCASCIPTDTPTVVETFYPDADDTTQGEWK